MWQIQSIPTPTIYAGESTGGITPVSRSASDVGRGAFALLSCSVPIIPSMLDGLRLWLDGTTLDTNPAVELWADQSGNGNDFLSDSVRATAPVYDTSQFPAGSASFGGPTDPMALFSFNSLDGQPFTVLMVGYFQNTGESNMFFSSETTSFYSHNDTPGSLNYYAGGDSATDVVIPFDTKSVLGVSITIGEPGKFYVNSVLQDTILTTNDGTGYQTACALFAWPTSSPSLWGKCICAEIVFYNRVLSQFEISALQAYWQSKWGL